MTAEEIKAAYSMKDIVQRYGFPTNRADFCRCPFHQGDHSASLKIYEKDFNCFGCGANGDIFRFVELMEQVSFKEAFLSLGGTYEKPSFSSRLAVYRSKKRRETLRNEQERLKRKKELNSALISIYRSYMAKSDPFSEVWCDCYHALQYQIYIQAELNGLESRW